MKNLKDFIKKYDVIFILLIFLILTKFTCLIKLITGFPCPACGITRAYWSLLHFRFIDAWNYNPLFWFIPPVVLFIIVGKKTLIQQSQKRNLIFNFCLLNNILSLLISNGYVISKYSSNGL